MDERQFYALLSYFDERIELQSCRDSVGAKTFYSKCDELKRTAMMAAFPEKDKKQEE